MVAERKPNWHLELVIGAGGSFGFNDQRLENILDYSIWFGPPNDKVGICISPITPGN